jgi:Flp pilus assembly protein TadG
VTLAPVTERRKGSGTRVLPFRSLKDSSGDRGSLTVFVAVFCVTLFVLIGLVVDTGRAISARSVAMSEAQQAARAGAGQVSVGALRSGQIEVDPVGAVNASEKYLESVGQTGWASVVGATVTVHVETEEPTVILGIVGINHIRISVSASAMDLHGVTEED